MSPLLPSLIVLTGQPGSGKTTLAHRLSREIRCPLVSRDEIKEGFVNTTGESGKPGDDIGRQIYEAFFDVIKLLLSRRITLVAEAAFQHKLWAPQLEPLREIALIRIIVCEVDPQVARSRHIERAIANPSRERFHHDQAWLVEQEGREPATGNYDPPHLDVPTLKVDTSSDYKPSFERIVSFAGERG